MSSTTKAMSDFMKEVEKATEELPDKYSILDIMNKQKERLFKEIDFHQNEINKFKSKIEYLNNKIEKLQQNSQGLVNIVRIYRKNNEINQEIRNNSESDIYEMIKKERENENIIKELEYQIAAQD